MTIEDVDGVIAQVVPLPDRREQPSLARGKGALHGQVANSDGWRSGEG